MFWLQINSFTSKHGWLLSLYCWILFRSCSFCSNFCDWMMLLLRMISQAKTSLFQVKIKDSNDFFLIRILWIKPDFLFCSFPKTSFMSLSFLKKRVLLNTFIMWFHTISENKKLPCFQRHRKNFFFFRDFEIQSRFQNCCKLWNDKKSWIFKFESCSLWKCTI